LALGKSPMMILSTFSVLLGLLLTTSLSCVKRFLAWCISKSNKDVLLESLRDSRLFEEWEAAAFQLDEILGYDLWYAANLSNCRMLTIPGAKRQTVNTTTID
jgi:hypothetical protein